MVLIGYTYRMNLRDLHYLQAVAAEKHFGKAALRVHVSQPTLSMQLKKLEEELGVVLFERGRTITTLTAVGAAVLAKAEAILLLEKEMRALAKAAHNPMAGEITLGAFPTLAPYLLPPLMPLLTEHFPALTIRLIEAKTAILIAQLQAGELECALIAAPLDAKGIISEPLFDEPFFLAVGKTHPLSNMPAITLADLEHYPLMLLDEGHCLREQALSVCHRIGAVESASFRATSLEMLRGMVASGRAITLMPALAMQPNDSLIYVPFSKPPTRQIVLAYRASSPRQMLMKKLAELIKNTISFKN